MTGVLRIPNARLMLWMSTGSPRSGRKGCPSETGGDHSDGPVSASNAQILFVIEKTYRTLCRLLSFIITRGTYSGCASIRGSSPARVKLKRLTKPRDRILAGDSVVSAVFAPVRVLS